MNSSINGTKVAEVVRFFNGKSLAVDEVHPAYLKAPDDVGLPCLTRLVVTDNASSLAD